MGGWGVQPPTLGFQARIQELEEIRCVAAEEERTRRPRFFDVLAVAKFT